MILIKSQGGARAVYLAPWGLYSRYILGAYLRHIMMVSAALMTIALTIDLWPQVGLFSGGPLHVVWDIARLTLLRLPDLLPPFIPFATFLGVVWSESALTESRERLLIWNSGRSPIFCLVPALMAGLVMAVALFVVDAWARPAAIDVQIDERLGREGIRLDRAQSGGNHWIALPDGLLRAEIEYGPPLKLHNVTVYKMDSNGHLFEVDTAATALPFGGGNWRLEQGRFTCAMALLGAALSMIYFAYQTGWLALVTVLLAGYLAHFSSKAFSLMGEFGYIAPFLAGWLAPLLLIAAVLRALFVIQKSRGLGARLVDTPNYTDATSG
ncbi:MAG: LptF/LptG family permease [Alphaproteobacteria bacterium]|nr:LptF/LptG family permease [Alphaproteobacteria bacterium]